MIPLLSMSLAAVVAGPTPQGEPMRLFDFTDARQAAAWRPVHDGVMGGLSSGGASATDEGVKFEGDVSLDNNGGFASFRIGVQMPDLTGFDGLRLRVKGDGQTYKLSLRTDGSWDGVGWQSSFLADGNGWTDVDLAFEDLVPTFRGRLVTGADAFDPSSIPQIGILIADKQEGPFTFELASIHARRFPEAGDGADSSPSQRRARTGRLAELVASEVEATGLASSLEWNERVLVMAMSNNLDADASHQLGRFLACGDALATRELRIVQLMGTRGGRLAGRALSSDQVDGLRERWDLAPRDWTLALVGKDGEVKERWSGPVTPEEVFSLIDRMPMRKQEMRERGSEESS